MIKKSIFYCLLFGAMLENSCSPKHIYNDIIISQLKNIDGTEAIEFNRGGLLFKDKRFKKKIIERYIYDGQKLIYRYPVSVEVIGKTNLRLLSGKDYLIVNVEDSLRIDNRNLPIGNRTTYVRGGSISRIDDSTYFIKVKEAKNDFVKVFVTISANSEEISGDPGYIADSLTLKVR